MDNLIKEIEQKPLSDEDIHKVLPNARIIKYSDLSKVRDLNYLLPRQTDYIIVLFEESPNSGHWISILRYNNSFEFFDSYGLKPDNERKWLTPQMLKLLNQQEPVITNLLDNSGKDWTYNNVKYQSSSDGINTCGDHVLHRIYQLINNNMTLIDYNKYMVMMKEKTNMTYDQIVANFISKFVAP